MGFTPGGAKAKVPVHWKQYLLTWFTIYPLVLGAQLVATPMLQRIGAYDNHHLTTLAVTGAVVFFDGLRCDASPHEVHQSVVI